MKNPVVHSQIQSTASNGCKVIYNFQDLYII